MIRDTVLFLDNLSSLPIRSVARDAVLAYRHNSILNSIRRKRDRARIRVQSRSLNRPIKLHIGCGHERKEGSLNLDIYKAPAADYVLDATNVPLPRNSVERIESYHVVEHLPYPIFRTAISEWNRLLHPDGQLVIELPDFDDCVQQYLDADDRKREKLLLEYVYGGQRHETDIHYWGWNEERLRAELAQAGFEAIKREEPQQNDRPAPCLRMVAGIAE